MTDLRPGPPASRALAMDAAALAGEAAHDSRRAGRRIGLRVFGSGLVLTMVMASQADTGVDVPAPVVEPLRAWRGDVSGPTRLAVDDAGVLYISDADRGQVVARAQDGGVLWRRGGLGRPLGLAVDVAGNLLIADGATGSVTAWDTDDWSAKYKLGVGTDEFGLPADVAVAQDTGRIYVADAKANLVRVYAADGTSTGSFGGTGSEAGQLDFPVALDIDTATGSIAVIDQRNFRVQLFGTDGTWISSIGEYGDEEGQLQAPQGVWIDTADRIWVSDATRGEVFVFSASGELLSTVGSFGTAPGQLRLPGDVLIDASNRAFVASTNNSRLEVWGLDDFEDPETIAPAFTTLDTSELRASTPLRARVEIPGYRIDQVDLASITANGVQATTVTQGDEDADGEDEVIAEFDGADLIETLAGETGGNLVLRGAMETLEFQAEPVPVTVFIEPADTGDTGDTDDTGELDSATPPATPATGIRGGVTQSPGVDLPGAGADGCGCAAARPPLAGLPLLLLLVRARRRARA